MSTAGPPPPPAYCRNDLTKLLVSYEREGANAISLPTSWSRAPPIFEKTQLVEEMERVADSLYQTTDSIWYFLIGAPGNGKSEAIGALLRRAAVHASATGTPNPLSGGTTGGGGTVCRRYSVQLPGARSLLIIQDATVPEDRLSDAAADLFSTLEDAASLAGTSVIVCANRGIVQRATQGRTGSVREILDFVTSATSEDSANPPAPLLVQRSVASDAFRVTAWPLDHESILFGGDDSNGWKDPTGSILDKVIRRIVGPDAWEGGACGNCAASPQCPLLENARWLRDRERRTAYLRILRRAEVWGGQRLVMREALELLTNSIVGSRYDFGKAHPCEWVEEHHRTLMASVPRATKLRSLLKLLARRIYMGLYARHAPAGLDLSVDGTDSEYLNALGSQPQVDDLAKAIRETDRSASKQAGLTRLAGPDGLLRDLDPVLGPAVDCNTSLDPDLRAKGQREAAEVAMGGALGGTESLLYAYATDIEADEDRLMPHLNSSQIQGGIARWLSAYTTRIVGMARAEHPHAFELEIYLSLMVAPRSAFVYRGKNEHLGDMVRAFLSSGGGTQYPAGRGLSVSIGNVFAEASPDQPRRRSSSPLWPASDRLAVELSPTGARQTYTAPLPAKVFLYLLLAEVRGLEDWCIPREIHLALSRWVRAIGGEAGVTRNPGIQATLKTSAGEFGILLSGGRITVKRT